MGHLQEQVLAKRKVGGQARAMVICSGKHEDNGRPVTEATLNDFPSGQTETKFQQDPYRFLVVADKFQTGYDERLSVTIGGDSPCKSRRFA